MQHIMFYFAVNTKRNFVNRSLERLDHVSGISNMNHFAKYSAPIDKRVPSSERVDISQNACISLKNGSY